MQSRWIGLAFALTTIMAASPASACLDSPPLVLEDVRFADTVVVGRIVNYRIALDARVRRELRIRKGRHGPVVQLLPDYARFDVLVDEVLVGKAGRRIAVTWNNSTFTEPATMAAGPWLIALRRPNSGRPPLGGISAYIPPGPDRRTRTVLQAPCSIPFMFKSGSQRAAEVRRIVAGRPGAGGH